MFKNCVLKPDVNTIKWAKAAGIRGVVSILTSVAGMPEVVGAEGE